MGRKYCEKRRNCSLPAISPFPTVFSKDLYCRHVKTRALFGKGLKSLLWKADNRLTKNFSSTLCVFLGIIHCSKKLKEHPNAEAEIFHFAIPSVFVLLQPSAYILTRQNDSIVFLFVSF